MLLLSAVDETACQPTSFELEPPNGSDEARARLRYLSGAKGVYVELHEDKTIVLRAEIPARPGELLAVVFRRARNGHWVAEVVGRRVTHLAIDLPYQPPTIVPPPVAEAPLDLVVVVDGSTVSASPKEGWLLADREAWSRHVHHLVQFVEGAAGKSTNARVASLAFADEALPHAKARDLIPRFKLHPDADAREFDDFSPALLRRRLLALPPSSGGDFVDALADALRSCRRDVQWRTESRKIVLVFGDSPGFSLQFPAPAGANARARARDVDVEALRLHERGVALMTVHHALPEDVVADALAVERELLDLAAAQYRRLASRPEWAFESSDFDPTAAAALVQSVSGRLGRGFTWGQWENGDDRCGESL